MANQHENQMRIVQETVAGKEITCAHADGRSCTDHLSEARIESAA